FRPTASRSTCCGGARRPRPRCRAPGRRRPARPGRRPAQAAWSMSTPRTPPPSRRCPASAPPPPRPSSTTASGTARSGRSTTSSTCGASARPSAPRSATSSRSEAVSDPWAVALAAAVWAAAVAAVDGHVPAPPLALPAGALAALLAAGAWPPAADRARRAAPAVLCLAGALASAALAHRSLAGLAAPLASGPVRAEVVLVGDPEPDGGGGVTALVRHEGRRLRATARGAAAAALDDRLTGERVAVVGEVTGPSAADRWARHRHVAGRLRVDTVLGGRAGDPGTRVADALRRTLARGASGLPARQRSLLAGVTLGDDRHQPPDLADAFAAAGLTHLLAVS